MPVRTNRLLASATTTTIEAVQSGPTWWGFDPVTAFGITDTIPGDTSTTASVPIGGSATAHISPGNDTDWFSINVVAGQTYLVSLRGSGSDPIEDPLLVLRDNAGAVLTQDDDGGSGINSLLTFTAAYTGAYFIEARTFSQTEPAGEYRVDVCQQGADAVPDTFAGAVALDLGEVTFGFIENGFDTVYADAGEVDRYRFEVEAGKSYTIEVAGGHDYSTDYLNLPPGELDTQIRIFGPGFGLVASNDDIAVPDDASSRGTFTALESGTYFLDVASWEGRTGGYSITASVETLDPLEAIDWGTQLASNAVTVYFAEAGEIFAGETSSGWSAYEIEQTMEALAVYSTFAGLTFSITDDQASATFTLVATALPGDLSGFMGPPGTANAGVGAFDVADVYWTTPGSIEQGGYSFYVMLHEFGHGLGLAHPHDEGGTSEIMPGVTAPRYSYGVFDLNQGVYTVMSYNASWPFHPDGLTPFSVETIGSGWSGTPGAFDIALIQQKYGSVAHKAGANTYVLSTANVAGAFYSCIWDTGGIDEIVQNGTVACRIDLTAATLDYSPTGGGVVSYVDGVFGGFTIANNVVIENAGGGSGNDVLIGNEAANILTGNDGEDELLGRAGADTLDGGDGNDRLDGGAGNDWLDGGAGADRAVGGEGNDTYVFDGSGDKAVEKAGNGNDTILSSVGLSMAGGIDNITLTGAAAINATGNGLDNLMIGNSAANELNGHTGADEMRGGAGNDTYSVDNLGDVVVENAGEGIDTVISKNSLTLGANVENLTLISTASIGTGNGLANILSGNALGNTLNGGAGADEMRGGAGNDLYFVDNAGDTVVEGSGNGTDTVSSSVSFSLGAYVENLTLTGSASINATGNGLANVLLGNTGNNTLNGGTGADEMRGGAGNDLYFVDNAGDTVVEGSGNGTDAVSSSVSFTLGSYVENLTLTGSSAISGTGNGLANHLVGNGAANGLAGGLGNDTLQGGGGNDVLNGGAGLDSLQGDAGSDQFLFDSVLNPVSNLDHILDFLHGSDKIVLENAVFATLATGALSANAFVLGTVAGDADDRILYNVATGALYYDSDGSGAAAAVQFAVLDTQPANLAASDFLVI